MKKILFTLMAVAMCGGALAQGNVRASEKGMWSFGVTLNYGTQIDGMGLGVKAGYGITDNLRLAPGFTYFFPRNGVTCWDVNADMQYMLALAPDVSLYPLLGLTVTGVEWDSDSNSDNKTTTRFGLNIGFGIEYDFAPNWAANFDYKYKIVSDIDQAIFTLGFAYKF